MVALVKLVFFTLFRVIIINLSSDFFKDNSTACFITLNSLTFFFTKYHQIHYWRDTHEIVMIREVCENEWKEKVIGSGDYEDKKNSND